MLFLSSCVGKKENIYCFSIVFDRSDSSPVVSYYCKKFSDNKSKVQKIDITGDSFAEAMCSINDKNYAIYLNSTEILFFSNNVSDKDIFEASATILNNMNYKTDVKVYSPIDDVIASTENFDAISREVCDKETAEFIGKSESIPFLKFIRNIESYRVN